MSRYDHKIETSLEGIEHLSKEKKEKKERKMKEKMKDKIGFIMSWRTRLIVDQEFLHSQSSVEISLYAALEYWNLE